MTLFGFFIIYFLLVFVLNSLRVFKRTGVNPLTFSRQDNAHNFNGRVFKGVAVMVILITGLYAFKSSWFVYLLPFWYLEIPFLGKVGWISLIFSLIFVSIAQNQMADSWRIGIDSSNKAELITSGVFSFSRNPVFLGILIANFGLFLIIPNCFSLLILVLSIVSIGTQVRLEEEYLLNEYGVEYEKYLRQVRRWI